jgi:hypothetical protein
VLVTFKGWQGRCFARQSRGRSEKPFTDTSAVLASKTGHFFVQITLVSQCRFRRYRASAHVSESAGIVRFGAAGLCTDVTALRNVNRSSEVEYCPSQGFQLLER